MLLHSTALSNKHIVPLVVCSFVLTLKYMIEIFFHAGLFLGLSWQITVQVKLLTKLKISKMIMNK